MLQKPSIASGAHKLIRKSIRVFISGSIYIRVSKRERTNPSPAPAESHATTWSQTNVRTFHFQTGCICGQKHLGNETLHEHWAPATVASIATLNRSFHLEVPQFTPESPAIACATVLTQAESPRSLRGAISMHWVLSGKLTWLFKLFRI
jgi:hypothetical protein